MKHLLLLLFLALFGSSFLQATTWRVNNTLIAPDQVDFNELKDAIESPDVAAGDTIYVEGSSVFYEGEIEVFKEVHIIGPGYLLAQAQTQPTSCQQLPATIGGLDAIDFSPGSEGSSMTGMTIDRQMAISTSNISITRNHVKSFFGLIGNDNGSEVGNIEIIRNLICQDIFVNTDVNNVFISNNLILGDIDYLGSSHTASNFTIKNNNIDGGIGIDGGSITFNYVRSIDPDDQHNLIQNNILEVDNADNQAIVAAHPTNVIDPFDTSVYGCGSDDWRLSPADQTDEHGAYNGNDPIYSTDNPISPANLPAIPVIYECEVEQCGDQEIQVFFRVRSNQ